MSTNLFNKIKSIYGDLSIDVVNSNGDVEISQNRLGNANKLVLTKEEIVKLGRCLLGKARSLNPPSLSPIGTLPYQSQKPKAQNAYEHWTEKDDLELKELYKKKKMSVEMLAKYFKRGNGAIESRLKKLGMK